MSPETVDPTRCVCSHTAGAHGLRGEPGCSFCSCKRFQRPEANKVKLELTRFAQRAMDLISKQQDFKTTSKDALANMVVDGHGRVYTPGQELVHRGTTTHVLHIVLSGSVSLDVQMADGTLKSIACGEGALVGDLRAFTGEDRWATVAATDSVEALEINTTKLKPVFAEYPDLFMTMAQCLARFAGQMGDFDATGELADATLKMALTQYAGTEAEAHRDGLDPKKAMEIQARWRQIKDAEREENRAQMAARAAIEAQTKGHAHR